MKSIKGKFLYKIVTFCFLLFFSCSPPDDEYEYVTHNVVLEDSVFIDDDKINYKIGEILWVNIDFPNVLTDVDGKNLEISKITSSPEAYISFKLGKIGEFENPARIVFSDNEIIEEMGILQPGAYDDTKLEGIIVKSGDGFQLRFGLKLQEEGDYVLSEFYDENDLIIYFEELGDENNDGYHEQVNITLNFKGTDGNKYQFSVAE